MLDDVDDAAVVWTLEVDVDEVVAELDWLLELLLVDVLDPGESVTK